MVAYNFNILNLNHNNSYFSGSSTIGNGTNTLFASIAGGLLLNTDHTADECSPAINVGSDALGTGFKIISRIHVLYTIDIGAYKAQATCVIPREMTSQNSEELIIKIYDTFYSERYKGEIQGKSFIETTD